MKTVLLQNTLCIYGVLARFNITFLNPVTRVANFDPHALHCAADSVKQQKHNYSLIWFSEALELNVKKMLRFRTWTRTVEMDIKKDNYIVYRKNICYRLEVRKFRIELRLLCKLESCFPDCFFFRVQWWRKDLYFIFLHNFIKKYLEMTWDLLILQEQNYGLIILCLSSVSCKKVIDMTGCSPVVFGSTCFLYRHICHCLYLVNCIKVDGVSLLAHSLGCRQFVYH